MTEGTGQAAILDYDPFSEEVLADPEPYDRVALAAGPVLYFPQYDLYALARHKLVRAAFPDWRAFCSGHGTGIVHTGKAGNWRRQSPVLENDPPNHGRYRKILQAVLTGGTLREIRARFASVADDMVRDLVAKGSFDGQRDLAEAFPLVVVPTMLGLSDEDRDVMISYSDLNFNSMGPDNAVRRASQARTMGSAERVAQLCRRESLAPGGLGHRIYDECEAAGMTVEDAAILVRTFFSASMDTTANSIGFTIQALAADPAQWAAVRANPALLQAAYEESLRHRAPSPHIGRTTTQEIEIEGVTIPADAKVLLMIAAADRDPERYEDPDTFDVTRKAPAHIAFGAGIHACIGQPLAKLEAELVLTALARHAATLRMDGTPTPQINNWLRGYATLPIAAEPDPAAASGSIKP
jgi:cytochrome P450